MYICVKMTNLFWWVAWQPKPFRPFFPHCPIFQRCQAEFVGFVRTSAFLQSDELDERLCEAGLSSWRTLTKLPEFRNPCAAARDGEAPALCGDQFWRFSVKKQLGMIF